MSKLMSSLSVVELQILAGLADGETLAELAERLHVGQAAVSKLIHAAERKCSLRLVEHQGRRLVLTFPGRELAREGARVIHQLPLIGRLVEDLRAGGTGILRVITTRMPGTYLFPPVISRFKRSLPGIDVDLRIVSSTKIWHELSEPGYDLGFAPPGEASTNVSIERVYDEPVMFFTAPAHPLAGRPTITRDDLRSVTLVGPLSQSAIATLIVHFFDEDLNVRRRIELRGPEATKRAVEAGECVGVHFVTGLEPEVGDGRLRLLPVEELDMAIPYCLIQPMDMHQSPVAGQFRSLLLEAIRDRPELAQFLPADVEPVSGSAMPPSLVGESRTVTVH